MTGGSHLGHDVGHAVTVLQIYQEEEQYSRETDHAWICGMEEKVGKAKNNFARRCERTDFHDNGRV